MDCNKDEAIRAKGIAEKKMQSDDFEGARKVAQKAQLLFPELENISQLLTVCDVHCSSRNKICGTDMDWYGILQVERFADEGTIKRQYRKLALVLHPDKNKFPGAEAAFKLIAQANMVFSDHGKRSLYDSRCRVSMGTAATKRPPPQSNRNPGDRKHPVPPKPSSSNGSQAFWTSCPFCNLRYQYLRDFVNRALRCQNCSKPFIAYDIGAQVVPPGSIHVQPAIPQQKKAQSQGSSRVGSQRTGSFPSSQMGSQGHFSSKTVGSEPVSRSNTAKAGEVSTNNVKADGCANKDGGEDGVRSATVHPVKPREAGTPRNTNRKRGRKLVVESSESRGTVTSSDTEVMNQENGGSTAGNSGLGGDHHPRRSFRQRQQVSYNENLSDDEFVSPSKKSRGNGSSRDSKEELEEEALNNRVPKTENSSDFAATVDRDKEDAKQKADVHVEQSLPNRNGEAGEHEVNIETVVADCNAKTSEVIDDSETDSDSSSAPDPEFFECPDPEFNDFDKDKKDDCFDVDQIWACYDTTDGMPRFYARVRKVFSPAFRLRITWLEPNPENKGEIDWCNQDLPFACGKFVHGDSEQTTDRLTFSHQVHCVKARSRGSYMIYPRKGETWALFQEWNINWSSDPEKHKEYRFEIVEVISDFVENDGIRVAYMDKVEGFVSVFQRTARQGMVFLQIPPTELLRFSHQVPSFKLIGTEREGVPKGSFELDPASLPSYFFEGGNGKFDGEGLDVKGNGSNPKSPEIGVKPMKSAEKLNSPGKGVDFEGKNDLANEVFNLRRSPRKMSNEKKHGHMSTSQYPTHEGIAKDVHDAKDEKPGELTPSKGSTPSGGDEKVKLPVHDTSAQAFAKSPRTLRSFSPGGKILEEFHNFNEDRADWKFQRNEIWALYSQEDGLPKNYAQVKKIETSPFCLHVSMLEICHMSNNRGQADCCGRFKLQTGITRVFSPSAFSHVLIKKADSIGKNRFEIYPRKGEIWALYKDWSADLSFSDLKKLKYEIVEVVGEEGEEDCTIVSPLVRLSGFKSVFKAARSQRSSSGVMKIARYELGRFSHQIHSFKLTTEKDGSLRGCWELDPASIPDFCN